MTQTASSLPHRGSNPASGARSAAARPVSRGIYHSAAAAAEPATPTSAPTGSVIETAVRRLSNHRRARLSLGELQVSRGMAFFDAFLLLLAVCAMLLPTTAGYSLAIAAAKSIVGLPFAVLMFLSPFALMALLPLRLLHLALDGFFGIELRLGLLAPLALVSLAMFLFLGPLSFSPMVEQTTVITDATPPGTSG